MFDVIFLLMAVFIVGSGALWLLALYGVNQWTRPARVRARDHPRNYNLPCEDVEFMSRDGVRLRGWLIAEEPPPRRFIHVAPPPSREVRGTGEGSRTLSREAGEGRVGVIFCHGHGGDKSPDLIYAPWFHARGISVLLFDFRNHGLSDGALTSMGFYERLDLLGAIDHLVARGVTRIGLFGFSMGAAIAIATTPLSEHVACVVADSPFAQLQPTLARAMQLRGFPRGFANRFMRVIFWMGKRRLRCDPAEADPVRAVSQFGQRPLLIILGERDEYIEPWQGRLLYEFASGPKELWLVPDATHRRVELQQSEIYREKVMGFFEERLKAAG